MMHIHETGKVGVGAAVGVIGGGLLSLIGGPVCVLAGVVGGAVVGGVAGYLLVQPISKGDLDEIGDAIRPGSSGLLMFQEENRIETVIKSVSVYSANVITLTMGFGLSVQIAWEEAAAYQGAAINTFVPKFGRRLRKEVLESSGKQAGAAINIR